MFHHLQVYLRKDRDLPLRFSKSPSTLAQSKLRLAADETKTPGYPTPLIRIDPRPDNSSPMTQGHSWRSFAAAHLAPIKGYLGHRGDDHQATPQHHQHHYHHHHLLHNPLTSEDGYDDGEAKKHSWTPFASRKLAKRSYSDSDGVTSTERIVLLPGWASRRYRAGMELSNRTGTSHRFLYKGADAHRSQVPRMTSRCSSLGMSSSTRPQAHYRVPNERY
jgi:hypothetical protein